MNESYDIAIKASEYTAFREQYYDLMEDAWTDQDELDFDFVLFDEEDGNYKYFGASRIVRIIQPDTLIYIALCDLERIEKLIAELRQLKAQTP